MINNFKQIRDLLKFRSDAISNAISLFDPSLMDVVSSERVREEFLKMFKHSTRETLQWLRWLDNTNSGLYEVIIKSFWLMPTNKQ